MTGFAHGKVINYSIKKPEQNSDFLIGGPYRDLPIASRMQAEPVASVPITFGGPYRDRTGRLLVANEALYQMS